MTVIHRREESGGSSSSSAPPPARRSQHYAAGTPHGVSNPVTAKIGERGGSECVSAFDGTATSSTLHETANRHFPSPTGVISSNSFSTSAASCQGERGAERPAGSLATCDARTLRSLRRKNANCNPSGGRANNPRPSSQVSGPSLRSEGPRKGEDAVAALQSSVDDTRSANKLSQKQSDYISSALRRKPSNTRQLTRDDTGRFRSKTSLMQPEAQCTFHATQAGAEAAMKPEQKRLRDEGSIVSGSKCKKRPVQTGGKTPTPAAAAHLDGDAEPGPNRRCKDEARRDRLRVSAPWPNCSHRWRDGGTRPSSIQPGRGFEAARNNQTVHLPQESSTHLLRPRKRRRKPFFSSYLAAAAGLLAGGSSFFTTFAEQPGRKKQNPEQQATVDEVSFDTETNQLNLKVSLGSKNADGATSSADEEEGGKAAAKTIIREGYYYDRESARRRTLLSSENGGAPGKDASDRDGVYNAIKRYLFEPFFEKRMRRQLVSYGTGGGATTLPTTNNWGEATYAFVNYDGTASTSIVATSATGTTNLFAGVLITGIKLEIKNAGDDWALTSTNMKIRFVSHAVTATVGMTVPTACKDGAATVLECAILPTVWCAGGGLGGFVRTSTTVIDKLDGTTGTATTLTSAGHGLTFKQGGVFQLCWSVDGTWDNAQLWRGFLLVNGYFHTGFCTGQPSATCMLDVQHKFHCFLLKNRYNNAANKYITFGTANKYPSNCIIGGATSVVANTQLAYTGKTQDLGGLFAKQDATTNQQGFEGDYTNPPGTSVFYPASWTAEYTYATAGTSLEQAAAASPCGGTPSTKLCKYGMDCAAGEYAVKLKDATTVNFGLPATKNNLAGPTFVPFTVGLCWCSFGSGCTKPSVIGNFARYKQQIGIVNFYLSKICRSNDASCDPDYSGVAPSTYFKVRVQCPKHACIQNTDNRVKIVMQLQTVDIETDKSVWDANNRCRATGPAHGVTVYPTPGGKPILTNPSDITAMNGGAGSEVKDFPPLAGGTTTYKQGFMFNYDSAFYERVQKHDQIMFDICYCDSACTSTNAADADNWFKVGQLRFAAFRFVSVAYAAASTPSAWAVQYIEEGGILGFRREPDDYDVMGLTETGILKIVPDQDLTMDDDKCRTTVYDTKLIQSGLNSEANAVSAYRGTRTTGGVSADKNKMIFNTGSLTNSITIKQAGIVAVCYCQWAATTGCSDNGLYWVLAGRTTIKGPSGGERWEFSTYVDFSLTYTGFGLAHENKLRIIHPDGSCTDNGGNPDRGSYAYTYLSLGCPSSCTQVGDVNSAVNGDLKTQVLSSDTECDPHFENCKPPNEIEKITVISDTETQIKFFEVPGGLSGNPLVEGDQIVLGDNISCDPTSYQCTPEKLALLKGSYNYADYTGNDDRATDEYIVAHTVKPDPNNDPKFWRIPVGFPRQCYPNACSSPTVGRPIFNTQNGVNYGKWRRVNKATTKLEIKGEREIQNMKVCWHYGSNVGKYVTEVGKLTLKASDPMSVAAVQMTTKLYNVKAPVLISFKTAGSMTGKSYQAAQGPMEIKFLFKDNTKFEVYQTDFDATPIVDTTTEDDRAEATQAVCGKLFIELWGDDVDKGFPLPRGCYYKRYPLDPSDPNGRSTRELYIAFDAKNGLQPETDYMVVMNGEFKCDLTQNFGNCGELHAAQKGGEYLEIFTSDDVSVNPYRAIERGIAALNRQPVKRDTATDETTPRFAEPIGCELLGGNNFLRELAQADKLLFQFAAQSTYPIKEGYIVRLYLQPITVWKTGDSCSVRCANAPASSTVCKYGSTTDKCIGEPVVAQFTGQNDVNLVKQPASSNNIIKIRLPGGTLSGSNLDPGGAMTSMPKSAQFPGQITQTFEISGVTIPNKGFFPTRAGCQVTDVGDNKPNYIRTSGNYFWKQPDVGQNIAKIVNVYGDGNQKPFKGDTDNVLYVKIVLGITSFAANLAATGEIASAYLTVKFPKGYTCKVPNQMGIDETGQMNYLATDKYNPWAAETSLNLINHTLPQGRGTPTTRVVLPTYTAPAPTNSHGWENAPGDVTTCYFKMNQYGILYRGSAIMVKFLVDNPSVAMQKNDTENDWMLTISGKGEYQTLLHTTPMRFKALESNYTANVAVLGFLTEAVISPSALVGATNTGRGIVHHELLVFFKTEQSAGYMSYVAIEAPKDQSPLPALTSLRHGFSFPNPCVAEALPHNYYARLAQSQNHVATEFIAGGVRECVYEPTPFNRALVGANGIMQANTKYGFKITATAPFAYASTQEWRLYTLDYVKQRIDGTKENVPFSMGMNNVSYGLFEDDLSNMPEGKTGPRVTINTANGVYKPGSTDIDVFFMKFYSSLTNVKVRISGPAGFQWRPSVKFGYKQAAAVQAEFAPRLNGQLPNADWPGGGLPTVLPGAEHVLQFDTPGTWTYSTAGTEFYSFTCNVLVPMYGPTMSPAYYYVEIGYDGATLAERPFGGVVPFVGVSSLVNAVVDYSTNVAGKESVLTFEIQTVTPVPQGGGLEIVGPVGFVVMHETIMPAVKTQGTDYQSLPSDIVVSTSTTQVAGSSGTVTKPVLLLTAGASGLPGARYAFSLLFINPVNPVVQEVSPSSSCGYTQCWDFATYSQMVAPRTTAQQLDTPIAATGFSVNTKLTEAALVETTTAQRVATERNDRPLKRNNLIFVFKMANDASESRCTNIEPGYTRCMELKLRGPAGFIFNGDCLPTVVVDEDKVFGDGNKWPPTYAVWPYKVKVTKCVGGPGPQATLQIEGPDARRFLEEKAEKQRRGLNTHNKHSPFLVANDVYAFRIGILANPPVTPNPNTWTIDVSDESSMAFVGFTLWTFTQLEVKPVSTARRQAATDSIPVSNPVRFTFRPWNTVPINGILRVTAAAQSLQQQNFRFVAANFECTAHVEELDWIDEKGRTNFGRRWSQDETSCRVSQTDDKITNLKLIGSSMETGRDYRVYIEVNNPLQERTNHKYVWKLESFVDETAAAAGALDESDVTSFMVNPVTIEIRSGSPPLVVPMVVNRDESGVQVRNGMMEVRDLTFTFAFPNRVDPGDIVVIEAPTGFKLESKFAEPARKQCSAFKWLPTLETIAAQQLDPQKNFGDMAALPNGHRTGPRCTRNLMMFEIQTAAMGGIAHEKDTQFQLSIDTRNPSQTPFLFENFFRIWHWRGIDKSIIHPPCALPGATWNCFLDALLGTDTSAGVYEWSTILSQQPTAQILSSEVIRSWEILPQLSSVSISLTGSKQAARAFSEITVEFTPVSDASEVRLVANNPPGFDFKSAALPLSLNPEGAIVDPLNPPVGASINIQAPIVANQRIRLVISMVELGLRGGQTDFDITTFGGAGTTKAMDEALNFVGGFRLPGFVMRPRYPRIYSEYERIPENYPIKSGFFPQMGSLCYADFHLMFSENVLPGHILTIEPSYTGDPSYMMERRNFKITKYNENNPPWFRSDLASDVVPATVIGLASRTLQAVICPEGCVQNGMQGFTYYSFTVSLIAPYQMGESWTFKTFDGGALPTNTNDGEQGQLQPNIVEAYGLRASAVRRSPKAKIECDLFIDPKTTSPVEMQLIAPPGLNFTAGDCLSPNNMAADIVSCQPLQAQLGRAKARLQVIQGGLTGPIIVKLIMETPPQMLFTDWYVEGTSQTQEVIGWGVDPVGFELRDMGPVRIRYTGVMDQESEMTFTFTTVETLTNGGVIVVEHPQGFEIKCDPTNLRKISLPSSGGDIECTKPTNPAAIPQFNLTLTETLVFGEYTFGVRALVPSSTPQNSKFAIMLFHRDDNKFARDAVFSIAPLTLQPGLDLRGRALDWTRAEAGKLSGITLSFEVRESPKSDGNVIKNRIGEILINFPMGFVHNIDALSHVEVSRQELDSATTVTPGMFLKTPNWLDYTEKDRIRISLNSPPGILENGIYQFTFLVTMPMQVPRDNVWTISLCEANGGCISASDKTVLVMFPVPGFALGQSQGSDSGRSQTAAAFPSRIPGVSSLVVVLLASLWSARR
ncbi:unnamed protein product [Amoebophrya sp. A120]|nr:unnamed protein product [Amoebophrya sp. A120]|eukprot:GSA120T00022729001.1